MTCAYVDTTTSFLSCFGLYGLRHSLCGIAFLVLASLQTAGASTDTPTAVALYFTGEPRTLNYTLCSIVRHIAQPLQAQNLTAVAFVYTYNHTTQSQYALLSTIPNLNVVLHQEPLRHVPPGPCVRKMAARIPLSAHYNAEMLSQFYERWQVNTMRQQYEREHGVRFAWVLMLRPDVVYLDPLPELANVSQDHVSVLDWHDSDGNGVNDRFAILPRRLADVYFDLYPTLCSSSRPIAPSVWNCETLYRWYLDLSSIPRTHLAAFYFMRVRMSLFQAGSSCCPFTKPDMRLNRPRLPEACGTLCACSQGGVCLGRGGLPEETRGAEGCTVALVQECTIQKWWRPRRRRN